MGKPSEEALFHFKFCLPSDYESTHEGNELLPWEQMFPTLLSQERTLRSMRNVEGSHNPEKRIQNHDSVCPCKTHEVQPDTITTYKSSTGHLMTKRTYLTHAKFIIGIKKKENKKRNKKKMKMRPL